MADFIYTYFDENGFIIINTIGEMGLELISPEKRMIVAPLSVWGVKYALAQTAPEYVASQEELDEIITALLKGWKNWHIDVRNSYRWTPRNDNGKYVSMAEQFLRNMEAETGQNWHPETSKTLGNLLKQKIEDDDEMF